MTTILLSIIASALSRGSLLRSPTGQRAEWLGVEGGEVLLHCLGGWAHGTTLRRPVADIISRWTLCRSDA